MAGTPRPTTRLPRATAASSYLIVSGWSRHLHYSDRRVAWIKTYVAGDTDGRRGLDDPTLAALTPTTRLLFELILKLAARHDNLVPNDPRRIAGWLSMRTQDVTRGIDDLVEHGYLEVVNHVTTTPGGDVQLPLDAGAPGVSTGRSTGDGEGVDNGSQSRPDVDLLPTWSRPDPDLIPSQSRPDPSPVTNGSAHANGLTPVDASAMLALTRAGARATEQEQELDLSTSKATVLRADAAALPLDSGMPEALRRLIGLAARGNPHSAAILRHYADGLPESAIGRATESYLGRRPRPSNPGGYVTATLKRLRAEHGLPEPATIEREPDL